MQVSVAALLAAICFSCGAPGGEYYGTVDKAKPGHLRWCNSGEPEYIDPAKVTSTTGVPIARAMFTGLYEFNAEGYGEPSMAVSMEKSDSFSRYTFTLRDDLKWSDGVAINAHDFAYHFARINQPTTFSRFAGQTWEAKIKNAKEYYENTARRTLVDLPGIPKGTFVDVIAVLKDGKPLLNKEGKPDLSSVPSSNLRLAASDIGLRAFPKDETEPHAKVGKGQEITLIEYDKSGAWAYVYRDSVGEGRYGWIKKDQVGAIAKGADVTLKVRALPRHRIPGELLSTEELLLAAEGKEYVPESGVGTLDLPTAKGADENTGIETKTDPGAVAQAKVDANKGNISPQPSDSPALVKPQDKADETTAGAADTAATSDVALAAAAPRKTRDIKLVEATARVDQLLLDPAVVGVYAKDDLTVVIETFAPTPAFVGSDLPGRAFRPTPRHAVSKHPNIWLDPRQSGKDAVVSGPFRITEWWPNDRMELVKNENFIGADKVRLDRLTVYNIDDQAAAATKYFTGDCDANTSNQVPASFLPFMRGLRGDRKGKGPYKDLTTVPYYGIYFYIINNEKMKNVHFRRALSLAIDRSPIPTLLAAGQVPTTAFNPGTAIEKLTPAERELCGVKEGQEGVAMIVKPGELCYVPPNGYGFDLEAAKKEFAIAKKELGSKFSLDIELKYNKGNEGHKILAEYVYDQWKRHLGLRVTLASEEWQTYLSSTSQGQFQVARMGWIGNSANPEGMLMIFRCDNTQNRSKYCDDEFEKHMNLAERESDEKKRLVHVRRAEEVMIKDMPVIPMYIYTQQHLQKPYVKGLPINFFDNLTFHRAYIDTEWREKQGEKKAEASR